MPARAIQVLGTGSHSGKSVLAAGLCRLLKRKGLKVAPFKSQNMALNSAATPSGHEIGRAQAVQAQAAGVAPRMEMNPILLKPSGGHRSQVILKGRNFGTMSAQEYYRRRDFFLDEALGCYRTLAADFEVVVLEGAGSPVEMNLMDRDIVNLPFARLVDARCLLVGDIDRGGIFASLIGTRHLLSDEDRRRIQAFVVNKFHGQTSLFEDGLRMLEQGTGWPCLGVVPFVDWLRLEEEDSVALESKRPTGGSGLRIAVLRLPHLSNYSDFDPLEPCNVRLAYTDSPQEVRRADLIVLPGSKSTISDLLWMRRKGLERAVAQAHESGAVVLGLCGGFQMLGTLVEDPGGEESNHRSVAGMGLLPMTTVMAPEKSTVQARAVTADDGTPVEGYEIHLGRSQFKGSPQPLFRLRRRGGEKLDEPEGVFHGRILATYLHGIFEGPEFTRWFLRRVAELRGIENYRPRVGFSREEIHDRWADLLEARLDLALLERLLEL